MAGSEKWSLVCDEGDRSGGKIKRVTSERERGWDEDEVMVGRNEEGDARSLRREGRLEFIYEVDRTGKMQDLRRTAL